jgi:glycosyltransferase involved in cell wall biosynthesis
MPKFVTKENDEKFTSTPNFSSYFKHLNFLPEGKGRKGEGGLRKLGNFKKGSKANPLITIITVVYNGENFFEKTIQSIINQTYKNIEYIIVDGGSTDHSIEIIKKYENKIDYWVSENDEGIYDAMNKGIILSKGDYIGFVNSDDYLYNETLEKFINAAKQKTIDYTVGPVDVISKSGRFKEKTIVLPSFLTNQRFKFSMATPHLSFYVSRDIINKIGLFDNNFRLRADYDMTIRVMQLSNKYFDFINSVGCFREGGVSGSYKTYTESFLVLRKHDISIIRSFINILPSLIKVFVTKNSPASWIKWIRKKISPEKFIK